MQPRPACSLAAAAVRPPPLDCHAMMQFLRDRHERQYQLAFNRGAIRGDIIYSICMAVFGLSAVYRLHGTPDAGSVVRGWARCWSLVGSSIRLAHTCTRL